MSDAERIERLEKTLATLITWLAQDLGTVGVNQLLMMLGPEQDKGDRS